MQKYLNNDYVSSPFNLDDAKNSYINNLNYNKCNSCGTNNIYPHGYINTSNNFDNCNKINNYYVISSKKFCNTSNNSVLKANADCNYLYTSCNGLNFSPHSECCNPCCSQNKPCDNCCDNNHDHNHIHQHNHTICIKPCITPPKEECIPRDKTKRLCKCADVFYLGNHNFDDKLHYDDEYFESIIDDGNMKYKYELYLQGPNKNNYIKNNKFKNYIFNPRYRYKKCP